VKDVAWNLGRVPYPYALEDAEEWLDGVPQRWAEDTAYIFASVHPDDGLIGCISLRLVPMDVWEIGYWLGKSWWGQGYTTEAAMALMTWAERDLQLSRFASGHFADNPASGRVLRKLGFEPVGETELYSLARGVNSPSVRYTKGTEPDLALRLAAH
jgi:RimJ/RimL family protein N-acetyltransferase